MFMTPHFQVSLLLRKLSHATFKFSILQYWLVRILKIKFSKLLLIRFTTPMSLQNITIVNRNLFSSFFRIKDEPYQKILNIFFKRELIKTVRLKVWTRLCKRSKPNFVDSSSSIKISHTEKLVIRDFVFTNKEEL